MPIFTIEPIQTTTRGGYSATITGINSNSTDFIVGIVKVEEMEREVSWDASGLCRDNHPDCNLDVTTNEFIEVSEAAKAFMPK